MTSDECRVKLKDVIEENPMAVVPVIEETERQISRLRFQLKTVARGLVSGLGRYSSFIVNWNVSEEELGKIHDVFKAQDAVLKIKNIRLAKPNWGVFETELVACLHGREGLVVSDVIWPFYHGCYWKDVCEGWNEWGGGW